MGWTAYYQVVRDRILDAAEVAAVAALVRKSQAEAWDGELFNLEVASVATPTGVVARGWNKLSMDEDSLDAERLVEALDGLQALVGDGVVNASDDFNTLARDAGGFAFGGRTKRKLVDDEGGTFESALARVPPPAASTQAPADAEPILFALRALTGREVVHEPFVATLAAADPLAVARIGLEHYQAVQSGYYVRSAIGDAFKRVTDVRPLVPAFLAAWATPAGTYYYGDMPDFERFAAIPEVRDRLLGDLDELESGTASAEIDQRRAEQAIVLLGRSADPIALRRLAAFLARWRTTTPSFWLEHRGLFPALGALAAAADPRWVPTTLLALDGKPGTTYGTRLALQHALRVSYDLAAPIVRSLLERGLAVESTLVAISDAKVEGAALADVITPYLDYPNGDTRNAARYALAAIMGTTAERIRDEDLGDPEPRVLHRSNEVRAAALRTVHDRKDPTYFIALVHGEHIDEVLRAATHSPAMPFSWFSWDGIVPEQVARGTYAQKRDWASGAGASVIGPQREWPTVAAAAARSNADLLATYPPVFIELGAATRANLEALEAAAFRG